MRHHNKNRKLGRKKNVRNALLKSLAIALIRHERITTTEAMAKELRPFIEKLVTKAREAKLPERRAIVAKLMNQNPESKKLIEDIAPRFKDQKGGYTRIMKLPRRAGDAAKMAIIEFVK